MNLNLGNKTSVVLPSFWDSDSFNCKCHGRQLTPNMCNLGRCTVWDVVVHPSSAPGFQCVAQSYRKCSTVIVDAPQGHVVRPHSGCLCDVPFLTAPRFVFLVGSAEMCKFSCLRGFTLVFITGDVRSSVVRASEFKSDDPGFDHPGGAGARDILYVNSSEFIL